MSWLNLNQSLNSLKGQITNFATEVLSEGVVPESGDKPSGSGDVVHELQEKCQRQESEIKSLNSALEELHAELNRERQARKNGVLEDDPSWYWDPVSNSQRHQTITADLEANYQSQIKALHKEISNLKEQVKPPDDEVERLREDNRALATNLEDLDNQHQQAMERLLSLKKELQKNFEVLKQEHEDLKNTNEEFSEEIKVFQDQIVEKDKLIEDLVAEKTDYDTLHHKYQNLERIHGLLRENAEKFQEENQDLHEEVFKLQEQVTKLEHEIEISTKHTELSDAVPRDRYEDLLKELNDMKKRRISTEPLDEVNIDDNAKSVIESLKRDISELKHKLTQKEVTSDSDDSKVVKTEKIMQLYNKYVNFELPVDYVGEMPSGDNIAVHKLESVFKTLHSFKKDIDNLEHKLSDKTLSANHLQTQIDDLTTENDFLTTDVHHYETELNEMKKNNDFLLNEIAALKNTSKLEPIIETHEDNLVKLETELADCNRMNRTFESEIKRVENELNEVKSEKLLLQKSLEDLKQKYTQMLSDFETFKVKSEAADGMEHDILAVQDDKLRKKSDEVNELKRQLTESQTKNEKLAIDITIIENDKVLLTKQVDDLKNKIEDMNKAHKGMESSRISMEANLKDFYEVKLQDAKKSINDLENKVKESRNDTTQTKQLTENLQILSKTNSELSNKLQKLTSEVETLNKREQTLLEENNNLQNNSLKLTEKCSSLENTITEIKSNVTDQDRFLEQFSVLDEENKALKETNAEVELSIAEVNEKLKQRQIEIEKQAADLKAKYLIIDSLNATIVEQASQITTLNNTVLDVQNIVTMKNNETETLMHNITELNERLAKLNEDARKSLEEDKEVLSNQIQSLQEDLSLKINEISKLRSQIEDLTLSNVELKTDVDTKEEHIKELNVSLIEVTDKTKVQDNNTHITSEEVSTEISTLKSNLAKKVKDIAELQAKITYYEANLTEYNKAVETVNKEKADLINLVTLKHNESIQYHAEIQRLNKVLLDQTNEFKRIQETKSQNNSEMCSHCDNLKVTLKEKDEIIKMLNENVPDVERLNKEYANASESVRMLTEKCDNLDKSLAIQLETVKKLTAENLQLSEQESNSSRELDRLRQHLLETEEGYTQELMASEQKLLECQNRLRQVEDRAKQTSTVYTSNSIRANQEVETLRNQIKLLEKQREDVQTKLSENEDARERSEAALANLQIVLEQFQSDKERDIEATTVKLRGKMAAIEKQNGDLNQEIARLGAKLEEALAGLQAATRLGDQLETKVAIINDLKEQVKTLQTSVTAAEERYYNAISNQQDKVDKELVKNLVVNYVMTQGQSGSNRTQILRVLSTVLDFNQQECTRLGLSRGTAPDSLAQEFVKFLQKESKPRVPPPDIAGIASREGSEAPSASASRKSSGLGPQPNPYDIGHKRNPSTGSNNLLFQNIDNMSTSSQVSIDSGVNQTRNTEGAILKHVLKDM